jgi:hypothetical protein
MDIEQIQTWEKLSVKFTKGEIVPDEQKKLDELRKIVIEESGQRTSGSGYVILGNWKWIYKDYFAAVQVGTCEKTHEIEDLIWWKSIELLENWVLSQCNKDLLQDINYWENLSLYLAKGKLPDDYRKKPGWADEVVKCKWGILRRKIKESVVSVVKSTSAEEKSPMLAGTIQERVEPLFNKILMRLNAEADTNNLETDQLLKLMNKLSSLLAEMKGETGKKDEGQVVNQNNVFIAIMNRDPSEKPPQQVLEAKAVEILQGEAYQLA